MRRLIQWWYRRQRATNAPPMTPEQEAAYWNAEAARLRKPLHMPPGVPAPTPAPVETPAPEPPPAMPPQDSLPQVYQTEGVHAEVTAIGNTCWPDWKPPIRALPRTARRILADTSVVFTADNLPLMDDPFIADFTWNVSAFDALTRARQTLPLHQARALYHVQHRPCSGMLTFTVYAPPLWCEDERAILAVERELRRQINESVCFAIWARVTFTWRKSNDPAWAVSIAAVDAPREGVA